MSFHEALFPTDVSLGARGGPERRTEVVLTGSGREERNQRWSRSRRKWNAGYGVKRLSQIESVIAFFEERRGRLYGFRWRDPLDHRSCAAGATPAPLDQTIGQGDGARSQFQLVKRYGASYAPYAREILKPVAASVRVAVGGVECAPSHFSVDPATGVIAFGPGHLPAPGLAVSAGFLFDTPARFDTDYLEIDAASFEAGEIPEIPSSKFSPEELMRALPSDFRDRLDTGATTLCACWRVIRRDGMVQGFTDHDRDIAFDGATYAVTSGLEGTGFDAELGFAVGGAEVSGALSAASIEEADLLNGAWDGARVELWRVDWRAPEHRILMHVGVIGEVRRSGGAFVAELRSLAHALDQERGRLYSANCDADLGDGRCRFALDAPPFALELAVASATRGEVAAALPSVADGFYAGGRIVFLDGVNAGAQAHVKDHRGDALTLWTPLAEAPAQGDRFKLTAGCDKAFATCREKFENHANFRGFPHLPGNDEVFAYASRGGKLDGGSMFR